jgi:hypothetical protein
MKRNESIECLQSRRQVFSLSPVQFGKIRGYKIYSLEFHI